MDLGAVQPERELPLDHERSQPPYGLRAGREADVVAQDPPDLLLLGLPLQDRLLAVEIAVEPLLEDRVEPGALLVGLEVPPLPLSGVELLQHLVEEAPPLHLDTPRRLGEAGVVVVPVEPRALQVVVQGGRREVVGVHALGTAVERLEVASRVRVGDEVEVGAEGAQALGLGGVEPGSRQQRLGLAGGQQRAHVELDANTGELGARRVPERFLAERRRAGRAVVHVRVGHVQARARSRHAHVREPRLLGEVLDRPGRPRRGEALEPALQPALVSPLEQRMGPGGEREQALGKAAQEDDLELETLRLVDGEQLHGVAVAGGGLDLVHGSRDVRVQAPRHVCDQRRRAVEPPPDLFELGERVEGRAQLDQSLLTVPLRDCQRQHPLHHPRLDQEPVGERRQRQPSRPADRLVVGRHRAVEGGELLRRHVLHVRRRGRWRPFLTRRGDACVALRLALVGRFSPGQRVRRLVRLTEPVHQAPDDAREGPALLDRVPAEPAGDTLVHPTQARAEQPLQ